MTIGLGREGAVAEQSERHLVPLAHDWWLWRIAAVRSAGLPIEMLDALTGPDAGDIDAVLLSDDFRSALTWQNPELMRNWAAEYVATLRKGERSRPSRWRRRAALIARYAQRYCARNDTIGFFGAVGWARFTSTGADMVWRGAGGIRRQSVHLEVWAAEAIADAWRDRPDLQEFLPVRLDPSSSFDGVMLHRAVRGPVRLDGLDTALLSALDGRRRCGEVAAEASRAQPGSIRDEALKALLELGERGIVQIGFQIPCDERPEMHLRRHVSELPVALPARAELAAGLDALDAAKRKITEAGPDELASALAAADDVLAQLTGAPPRRNPAAVAPSSGLRYGRTTHYLDCRRDLDVEFGPVLRDQLAAPLAIVLDSARWLAAEIGAAAHRELRQRFATLSRRSDHVTLGALQFASADILSDAGGWTAEIVEDFQLRWKEILELSGSGERETVVHSDAAARLAKSLFPSLPLWWSAARYHSPDLLLARRPDGGWLWVLGELHVGLNTLESRVFLTQADSPEELRAATAADMKLGRIVPVYPNSAPEVTARTYPPTALDPPGLYRYWSYGADQGHPEGAASTPSAELSVVERDGVLLGQHRKGGWEAPVTEFFGEFLTALVVNCFRPRPPDQHVPRVRIDDLVLCRESWRFSAADVPVSPSGEDHARYLDLRTWAENQGIPRRFFVKTAAEPKPMYIDLCAPLLVDNLVRVVRRVRAGGDAQASQVEFTEMLPGPDELWLTDAAGRRYTSEFRVVAVDTQETMPVVRVREKDDIGPAASP
ncbi:hypothetical protein GCM10029978_112180 [Actinoallomurus acanthiterrae]